MGYKAPTPIQEMAIPIILQGRDLIACAQTGTGKTASFLLPVLEHAGKTDKKHINTLILAPTRELAQQIDQQAEGLAYFTGISSAAVFGGGDGITYEQQRRAILNHVNILIATPGRLIGHLVSGIVKLDKLQHLILDEADRMLDMGFQEDIMRIISYLPKNRQTLLFSATMPPKIRSLAKSILKNPEQVNIAAAQPAEGIDQQVYLVHEEQKIPLIQQLFKNTSYSSVIVFASTKEKVKAVYKALKKLGMQLKAFHSDLDQSEREEILLEFKNRKLQVLVGTDVLSRGIDVEGIDLVVNFDVPGDPEDYIHRIGRTARAASTGTAITFVNERDQRRLFNIEAMINRSIQQMEYPAELGEKPIFKPYAPRDKKKRRPSKGKRNFQAKAGR